MAKEAAPDNSQNAEVKTLNRTLMLRIHQSAIDRLDHFRHILFFKNRSDMIRCAIIESAYYTLKGKRKLKSKLGGNTKVIGCRLPDNLFKLILKMNSKQRGDTVSVWAAIAVYDWLERIEKVVERNMKSNVYHSLCQRFTYDYRPQVESLLMELNEMEPVK